MVHKFSPVTINLRLGILNLSAKLFGNEYDKLALLMYHLVPLRIQNVELSLINGESERGYSALGFDGVQWSAQKNGWLRL